MRRFELTLGALVLVAGVAMADEKPLDVTIQVVDSPAASPSAVTRTIELPPSASAKARERSEHGRDAANEARTDARQTLQGVVEETKTELLDPVLEEPLPLPLDTSDALQ